MVNLFWRIQTINKLFTLISEHVGENEGGERGYGRGIRISLRTFIERE